MASGRLFLVQGAILPESPVSVGGLGARHTQMLILSFRPHELYSALLLAQIHTLYI